MNKLIIITTFLLLSTLKAAESQVDLRIDTDPNNLDGKTSFNVTTTTALLSKSENHAILVTPEMSFYSNGGIDFSVATAHRHRYKNWVIGHTMFFDRTNLGYFSLDQVGTGIDLQTSRYDFRANYYHPISNSSKYPIMACKWVDAEIFFKTRYFGVGTGPLYNINMKSWALHSRLVLPFKSFSLNFGAICGGGEYSQSQAIFSISFHLFKPTKADALISPPCHVQKSNIYYNTNYSYDLTYTDYAQPSKIKLDYNPNQVTYIEQYEEDATFPSRDNKENNTRNNL